MFLGANNSDRVGVHNNLLSLHRHHTAEREPAVPIHFAAGNCDFNSKLQVSHFSTP